MYWVIFWCTVNFIQHDSSPWIRCGHNAKFTERKGAIEFYQALKKLEEPDTMALKVPGVYNVKFDSVKK
jgi:hypothetical protein